MNAIAEEVSETGKEIAPYLSAIQKAKERFSSVAGDLVSYDKESIFAMQALMKTDYALQIANKNPRSVQLAMVNVASTGLTLNPAHGYAYLVPRDGAIVLDISYKGLIKIATDAGGILWARADLVYAEDSFAYHGPALIPDHTANCFKPDRGELIGAYCIAKTREGDILTEVMALEEIEKIRGKSDLYAKRKSGPWVEWFAQMVKKAVIKRASKTWPYTGRSGKLFEAIEIANASEGGYTLDGADDIGKLDMAAELRERCKLAYDEHSESVDYIKSCLDSGDFKNAASEWALLSAPIREHLDLAPSKGGCFTTEQRRLISTNDFARAFRAALGLPPIHQ